MVSLAGDELLPQPFYISATPKRGKNPKLFRPKELRELVFPDIGLVMYDLFWVKYLLHLSLNKGYDLSDQDYLFLWAEKDGSIEPEEGVLYYSLLSKYLNEQKDIKDVSVGKRAAKGWLFKNNWQERLTNKLMDFSQNPEGFDFKDFVEYVFSSDFKSKCKNKDIDLANTFKLQMSNVDFTDSNSDIRAKETIGKFVNSLARIFQREESLHGKNNNEIVIGPNITFTQDLLLGLDPSELKDLANTEIEFNKNEVEEFISALELSREGRRLLRSFILISYFNPLNKDNDRIKEKMRKVDEFFENDPDFKTQTLSKFDDIGFSSHVTEKLEETCFYWLINFFLGDGEDIARKLLNEKNENNDSDLNAGSVREYLDKSSNEKVEYFEKNYEKVYRKWRDRLSKLVKDLENNQENEVADYLSLLLQRLEKNKAIEETFLELLQKQKTIERETEDLFIITNPYSDNSPSASFYAIGQAINWSKTILRGIKND